MIKAVLIDDEEMAREIISDYLEDFEDIEVVAHCDDGFSGLKAIQDKNPDLVFLDVQMPKLTGFEMLEVLDEKPAIIFTTAYDQYAIQAFEQNAVDYLLKPFSPERFNAAVKKAISRIREGTERPEKEKLREHLDEKEEYKNRVVVKYRKEIRIIPVNQINYIEAHDDYVMIYTEKEKFLKQKTMKYFESHLDPGEFVRLHRSYIVRVDRIARIEPYEKSNFIVVLKDDKSLPVSKSGFTKLKSILDL
ncbi:MAG: LytR/AlgR family response regulator transcription factor [Bacteroidota bacterium]